MKDRTSRLRAIKQIIRNNRVSSQELLLQLLEKDGYLVTQATLSRDLKLLKVGKISEGAEGYIYSLPGEEERRESEQNYLADFQRGYVGVEFSMNLGVVRTLAGHADSVALALDNLGLEEIAGTIAGDDTVLVVLREGFSSAQLLAQLRKRIPDLEE